MTPCLCFCFILTQLDIFDRAWLEVIRLHPEIPIDDSGNSLVVRRNRNLEITCPPAVTQPVGNPSSSPVVAVTSCIDIMCFATGDGSVKLVRGGHQIVLPMLTEGDVIDNPLFSTVRLTNAVSISASKNKTSIVRFAFYHIWELDSSKEPVAEAAPAGGAKKAPAPAKGKEQAAATPGPESSAPKRSFGLKYKILEAVENNKVPMRYSLRIADEWVTCENIGGIDASLNFSVDGKILCLCHGDSSASIFEVPLLNIDVDQTASSLAPVMEHGEHQESGNQICSFKCNKVAMVNAAEILNISTSDPGVKAPKIWQIIPFLQISEPIIEGKSKKPAETPSDDGFRKYQFLVVPDNSTRWMIAGFNPIPTPAPVAPVAAAATTPAAAAGKGAAAAPPPSEPSPNAGLEKPVVLGSWISSGVITSLCLDASFSAAAFGTQDGTVTAWDLVNRTLLCVCAKHLAPITCLKFCAGSDYYLLCSGSSDGAVCFNQIRKFGKQMIGQNFEPISKLIQSRVDAYTSPVVSMLPVDGMSLIACFYANGTTGMYDAESGSLLGQIVLCIGMEAQLSTSKPVAEYQQLLKAGLSEASKNYVSSNFTENGSKILCANGKFGLSIFFDQVQNKNKDAAPTTICAVYPVDKIVDSLCPGVVSIKTALRGMEHSPDLPSSLIYKLLNPMDRTNSNVSVAAIQDTLSHETANPRRRVSALSAIPETPQAVLTEERLKAHNSFDLALKPAPAPLGNVSSFSTTRSLKKSALGQSLLSNLKSSTAEAGKRKNNNVKLLNQMMAMMPSS